MKRTRKILAAILLVLVCLSSLSGCHGRKEETAAFTVPEAFDTSKDYEITFWAKNDTNKTQTDIFFQSIDFFQVLFSYFSVSLRLY